MSKSNNSSDDFKLDSSNPYAKFKGLKYYEAVNSIEGHKIFKRHI